MLALMIAAALLATASADYDMSFASRPAQHIMHTGMVGAAENEGILAVGHDTGMDDDDDMSLHGMEISTSLLMKGASSPTPRSFSSLNLADHSGLEGDVLIHAAHDSDNLPQGMDEASAHVLAFSVSLQGDAAATQVDPNAFIADARTAFAKALHLHRGQVKIDNLRGDASSTIMDVAILLPPSSPTSAAEEVKAAFLTGTSALLSHLGQQHGVRGGSSVFLGESGSRQVQAAPTAMLGASSATAGICKSVAAVGLVLLGVALL